MPNGLARPPQAAPSAVQAMIAAADRIDDFDYQYGGGHADPALSDSQTDPQPQGGLRPGDNGTPGYDCSGATDYVLWGGGLAQSILDGSDPASGELMQLGAPARAGGSPGGPTAGTCSSRSPGSCLTPATSSRPGRPSPSTGPRWTVLADVAAQQQADGPFSPRHPEGL